MRPTLYFVTSNVHKVAEVQEVLLDFNVIQKNLMLVEIQGKSEQVVVAKAKEAARLANCPILVDDSAVQISAFNGFPDAYAADFNKIVGNERLLTMLKGFDDRSARMISYAAYCEPGKEPVVFEGVVEGTIASECRGKEGFGFDPVFIPEDQEKTFAQMSVAEKNTMNHRARAFTKLRVYLTETFIKGS